MLEIAYVRNICACHFFENKYKKCLCKEKTDNSLIMKYS